MVKKILEPMYYIFPVAVIQSAPRSDDWGKVNMKSIPNFESYQNNWSSIVDFLGIPVIEGRNGGL